MIHAKGENPLRGLEKEEKEGTRLKKINNTILQNSNTEINNGRRIRRPGR